MKAQTISAFLTPIVEACGLELDDVHVVPAGKRSVVRVTVDGDGPKGRGLTMDEISAATRAISDALDNSDVTGEAPYTLEVSSRGTSAPLVKPAQWRRNRGRLVKVTVGDETLTGRIVDADAEGALLAIEGTERRIAFADARKAVVQVELNRPFDPDLDDEPIDAADDDSDVTDVAPDEEK